MSEGCEDHCESQNKTRHITRAEIIRALTIRASRIATRKNLKPGTEIRIGKLTFVVK